MGKKFSPNQLALYKEIDEILFYKWDPIGISSEDWPRDEYHAYLPVVFSMVTKGQTSEDIANYLTYISTEYMGLEPATDIDKKVAELVVAAKNSKTSSNSEHGL